MGIFSMLKRKKNYEMLNVSGEVLIAILERAIEECKTRVDGKYYSNGPEIMFDYEEEIHFIGVRYDKKGAKKEKIEKFDEKYLSVFLDKKEYYSLDTLREEACIKDMPLKNVLSGIELNLEYADMVEDIKGKKSVV